MAATAAGARLTAEHRLGQIAVRSQALRDVLQVWPALDPERLAASWPPVEAALLSVIARRRGQSATVAAGYFEAFRDAEGISGAANPVIANFGEVAASRAGTSLRVTGPATIVRLTALHRPAPVQTALVRVTGAVSRHVLDGGRETLVSSVRADRRALGWARAASGNACAFCAMLASRGPVYGEHSGAFQAHDHCSCSLEPVYSRNQEWPKRSRDYEQLWSDATDGLRGMRARNAFRAAFAER